MFKGGFIYITQSVPSVQCNTAITNICILHESNITRNAKCQKHVESVS